MSTYDSFEVEVDDPEGTERSYGAGEKKGLYKLNIDQRRKSLKQRTLSGWLKHGDKIILVVGIILIAAISFEAGFLKGQKNQKEPVMINQPAGAPCPKIEEGGNSNSTSTDNVQQNNQNKAENQPNTENQKCAFVASKNSSKYHLPTCQWANKIKSENKICFSSVEEAQKRGYQPAKCCIK